MSSAFDTTMYEAGVDSKGSMAVRIQIVKIADSIVVLKRLMELVKESATNWEKGTDFDKLMTSLSDAQNEIDSLVRATSDGF